MADVILEAKKRTVIKSKVKALRRQGVLPAVVYGAGISSTSIELDAQEATKVLSNIGASTLLNLKVENQTHQVLVREIQRHVIRRDLLHVDFLKVSMDVMIRTEVPIEFIGEAPAVKELGGLLVTGLNEVEVEALPGDLPDRYVVDLGKLVEMDDVIPISDLEISEKVELLTSPDEVLARIVYQIEEVEEEVEVEELFEEDLEPEVIERGKREEEEAKEETED